jgi:hypothetical protein
VSGAGLAEAGHDVLCMDIDADRIANLRQGHAPIYEQGLDEILVSDNMCESHFLQQYSHFLLDKIEILSYPSIQGVLSKKGKSKLSFKTVLTERDILGVINQPPARKLTTLVMCAGGNNETFQRNQYCRKGRT